MTKQGEIDYLRSIGDAGRRFTINKPFSDPNCAGHLLELGAILTLLPPPPARLLDVGCGTGWTSRLFARRGYDVVGVDISPDMVAQARRDSILDNLRFLVGDYEEMQFDEAFDAAVFYDSLHHALDETQARTDGASRIEAGRHLSHGGTGTRSCRRHWRRSRRCRSTA